MTRLEIPACTTTTLASGKVGSGSTEDSSQFSGLRQTPSDQPLAQNSPQKGLETLSESGSVTPIDEPRRLLIYDERLDAVNEANPALSAGTV